MVFKSHDGDEAEEPDRMFGLSRGEPYSACQMRLMLTVLFGPKYVVGAAAALGVQENRIRFWVTDRQDKSPFPSSPEIRRQLEGMFKDRVQRSDKVLHRLDEIMEMVNYLDDLADSVLP